MTETARKETLEHIRQLVAFNTVSDQPNRELVDYLATVLDDLGFEIRLEPSANTEKANLIARLGPDVPDGLMLAGHTDVVPVAGQNWSADPFIARIQDGKVYGRGTCDMKGFIAVVLSVLPCITLKELQRPLHLAFTFDEEVGCFGAHTIAPILAGIHNPPTRCIVGEPTSMALVAGHKGKLSMDCAVQGTEGHSAFSNTGVNAVEIAAELVTRLRHIQARIRKSGPFDTRFDPPYTTVHTGLLQGGTARNIVPKNCRFEFEVRNLPGHDPQGILAELGELIRQELLPEIQSISTGANIDMHTQSDIPGLMADIDTPWMQRLMRTTRQNAPKYVSFATEGGLYQSGGINTIICGPGNIEQAHKADEYIEIAQLVACEKFLSRIIGDTLYPHTCP